MNVNVEDISSIKKKVSIEIPEDQVIKEVESFYKDLGKKAKIKGFRPGKVPRNILERHFKDYVKAEVIQKLIQETYPTALSETQLQPVANPMIDPGDLESGKPFQYSATVEVKPEIKLEQYVGLNIEGKKEEAKDEEVEERLKNLQDLHANLKTIQEARPSRMEISSSLIMRRGWTESHWRRGRPSILPSRLGAAASFQPLKRS